MGFPLSALVIMASFFLSLDLMEFISLASGCGLCVSRYSDIVCLCGLPLFSCRFLFHWWVAARWQSQLLNLGSVSSFSL